MPAENRPDGGRDLSGRKTGGSYLIEQRLKGVMILTIDEVMLTGARAKAWGVQAPKPAPTITTRCAA